jgi:hypothetical protein
VHIEFLVEDSSGMTLLEALVPKLIGHNGAPHSWRIHPYKGMGRLPKTGLGPWSDPAKRILLDQLPRVLRGFGKTPGIDAIVVVMDADKRDCVSFLDELRALARHCDVGEKTMFRLAIEEVEAWYLGDVEALLAAYPSAKRKILNGYAQDSVCGTWELLADALVAGGSAEVKRSRGPHAGDLKHEWARAIGPLMAPDRNISPSFAKLREGLRSVAGMG